MSQREKLVTWQDPAPGPAALPTMSGLDYLKAMAAEELPSAPIASHIEMKLAHVDQGTITFECQPDESHYNPIGTVHGGVVCTLLDSALGCAVHTTLPAGVGYTSIDLKVNYLRPIHADSGPLRCVGTVIKPGSRVAFAEGVVTDATDKQVATATGSVLVFPLS